MKSVQLFYISAHCLIINGIFNISILRQVSSEHALRECHLAHTHSHRSGMHINHNRSIYTSLCKIALAVLWDLINHWFSLNTIPETLPKFLEAKGLINCHSLSYIFLMNVYTVYTRLFEPHTFFIGINLTHPGWDKMATNHFSNLFPCMKINVYWKCIGLCPISN